jgi:hypothetical protein
MSAEGRTAMHLTDTFTRTLLPADLGCRQRTLSRWMASQRSNEQTCLSIAGGMPQEIRSSRKWARSIGHQRSAAA